MGGAERANLELIDALRNRGVECFAILPHYGPVIKELERRNVPFKVFPYRWWMVGEGSPLWIRVYRIVLNLAMILPVAMQLRKWRVDVVVTNTITVCVGAFAAKILKVSHSWYVHEFGYEDHRLFYVLDSKVSLVVDEQINNGLYHLFSRSRRKVAEKYRLFISNENFITVHI